MTLVLFRRTAISSTVAAVALLVAGCGQTDNDEQGTSSQPNQVSGELSSDDHSGWWCAGHGVPEEECSLCSAKAADRFKAQGDWCEEHSRAESQCFICNPEGAEKYVALYEAKYGKKPPKPTD